jgi:hypothetical protein
LAHDLPILPFRSALNALAVRSDYEDNCGGLASFNGGDVSRVGRIL